MLLQSQRAALQLRLRRARVKIAMESVVRRCAAGKRVCRGAAVEMILVVRPSGQLDRVAASRVCFGKYCRSLPTDENWFADEVLECVVPPFRELHLPPLVPGHSPAGIETRIPFELR